MNQKQHWFIHGESPREADTKRRKIMPLVSLAFTRQERNVIFTCKKTLQILTAKWRNLHSCVSAQKTHMHKPSEAEEQHHCSEMAVESFPLASGEAKSVSANFFTRYQVIALKKCAHKGLRLATYTCKCKPSHSTFGTRAFQMQINSYWTGFTSCGVQCTQPPTQKWEWHRKL